MTHFVVTFLGFILMQSPLAAQLDSAVIDPAPVGSIVPDDRVLPDQRVFDQRIFGVIPAYHFVEKPQVKLPPLTPKQKFALFAKETIDPFTIIGAAAGASVSHLMQSDPQYGEGSRAYRQRLGAAYVDVATQNFFSDGLLAVVFKEDPRYYRLGPQASVLRRVGYSLSRVAVGRTDAGNTRISYSSLLGTAMGIGLSNAYYPRSDQNGLEMVSRVMTSFTASAVTNLLPEFWPDIKQKFAHWHKPAEKP
jgi:hypothetical protein